jgi:hypothetical protein
MRRTPTGQEVKRVIANTCAGFELAAEHRRRADWRKCELSANSFKTEYGHARDAAPPHPVHDRLD